MPRHRPDEWSRPAFRWRPAAAWSARTLSSHYSSLPQSRTRAALRVAPCPREPAAYSPAGWPAPPRPRASPGRLRRPHPAAAGGAPPPRLAGQGPARAVILALHGFGDAGDLTFEDAARAWSARGIAVYAPDQRGFGANREPPRLARHRRARRRRRRPLPLAPRPPPRPAPRRRRPLHGRRRRARRRRARPRRRRPCPRRPRHRRRRRAQPPLPHRRPHRRRRRCRRSAGPAGASSRIRPTDNPAAIARVVADPRHFGDPTSRELYGLVQLMDRAAADRARGDAPDPVLMGARDEVLRPAQVRKVADTIPGVQLPPLPGRLALALPRPAGPHASGRTSATSSSRAKRP